MASAARAARRRALRSVDKLGARVHTVMAGQTPTQRFGCGLDKWAETEGRRIRITRTLSLGKWRTLVIFKAEPKPVDPEVEFLAYMKRAEHANMRRPSS